MLKFVDVLETFREVPDEISLSIDISNCPHRCKGCHSAYLQTDIGKELTESTLDKLINIYKGITCITFLGGDSDVQYLSKLVNYIHGKYPNLKICWYTGFDNKVFSKYKTFVDSLDFIKTGEYIEEKGPLHSKHTNQHFYKKYHKFWEDITYKFQISNVDQK